jgi:hypothetical protein
MDSLKIIIYLSTARGAQQIVLVMIQDNGLILFIFQSAAQIDANYVQIHLRWIVVNALMEPTAFPALMISIWGVTADATWIVALMIFFGLLRKLLIESKLGQF